ncbi:hypothetical protein AJ78_06316 [Emergomyces pasteurianus Ep9510]|uniref:Protein kinase domain-containing protein n=1 Tax=Emergomyces pasteurianus Ep9510 TaxID=1447872 RepID=A0A1J9PAY3_9EURO|nr:hypothetical protein AJ78_06316 [Emergomyces pasteurianus Ep9510]
MVIKHLHANHVTHHNLKPANILVKSYVSFHVKLCDFDLTKVADEDTVLRTFYRTYMYCAPEIYLDLLSTEVLRIKPRERLSADESLRRVKDLEPLVPHSFSLKSTSPVSQRSSTSDDDEGLILIMRGLWGSGGVSSNAGSSGSFGIPRLAFKEQNRCTVDGSALQKRR